MNKIQVQFLGSGDAFGSGGRLQPCIFVKTAETRFIIDCGATTLIAMRRYGIDPNDVDMILLSHLHGDHFCGIPFFVLDAQLVSKRTKPLLIAGPGGTKQKVAMLMEIMFPGSSEVQRKFPVDIMELQPEQTQILAGVTVTPYPVVHTTADDSFALRIECSGQTLAYTGDTEWTDALIPACQGVDLLIAEAYYYEKKIKYHLDYQSLMARMPDIRPQRLVITHMGADMLLQVSRVECEYAEDGKMIAW